MYIDYNTSSLKKLYDKNSKRSEKNKINASRLLADKGDRSKNLL